MDGPFVTFCTEPQPASEVLPIQPGSSVVVVTEEDDSGEQIVAPTAAAGPPKIIYLDRVCRTCLVEREKDDLKDLFEFGLAETVMSCVGRIIAIEESDGLPGHICMECLQEVDRIISFRQQCERSDGTIRNLIDKSVVIKQDSETKYEVLNVVLTDANGNTETSAVVVPIEELRFQLMNSGGGRCSEEVVETEPTTSENLELSFVAPSDLLVTEEIIVQSQQEEDVAPINQCELVYEDGSIEEQQQQQQQESTVIENLRQELSEFIGGTCAEISKDQDLDENDDDEIILNDYLKDALTDEYIQSMEQQLAPSVPPRSENPAQDRLEQANLNSLINDGNRSDTAEDDDHSIRSEQEADCGGSKHHCDVCNVGFDSQRKFRVHMKKHSEIIVQSQQEEDVAPINQCELVYEDGSIEEQQQQQQQESTVIENLRQELSEFIGGTCAEISKDQDLDENDDDEIILNDYLKDALTDEYIQSMEQQLAPSVPPRSENPAQDRLEQANLNSLINDGNRSDTAEDDDHSIRSEQEADCGGSKHHCDVCNVGFDSQRKFRVHMKKHSEKQYECSYCSRRFAEQSQLRNHVLRHTGEKAFSCEVCDARFYDRNALNVHMRRHNGVKPYGCDVCSKRFGTKSLLNTHIKCHLGEKKHICEVCKKGFTLSWQLKAHLRIHTNEKPFECPYCLKRFNQNGNLMIHKRIHTGERPFQCELCEKAYPSQGELSTHMRQHTGEKKVKNVTCSVCQKSFAGNGDLKIHMRTHTKERPFSCQLCGKAFMLQVHLTVHMRTHTGEKPFSCMLCQKAFSTNYQQKHHSYVHTGEKNYACEVCNRRFSSAANRNTHRKTHERKIS